MKSKLPLKRGPPSGGPLQQQDLTLFGLSSCFFKKFWANYDISSFLKDLMGNPLQTLKIMKK